MAELFPKLDATIRGFLRRFSIALLIALSLLLVANVLLRLTNDLSIALTDRGYADAAAFIQRLLPLVSMHWFDEILELLYGALVFYGAAAVWVVHGHFSVGDWISKHLPSVRARFVYRLLVELASLVFIAIFFWYAL